MTLASSRNGAWPSATDVCALLQPSHRRSEGGTMALFRRGSQGVEVAKIQARLKELGHYLGPIDADFGGGTEVAVRVFQKAKGLQVDGKVGPITWAALFDGAAIEEPGIFSKPLEFRSLALTGSFETSAPIPECFAGLTGDFDGQGISFGTLQWNIGQGSLQPLLEEMDQTHLDILQEIFGPNFPVLRAMLKTDREEQLAWARSIQDLNRFVLFEPWRGQFKTLGRREEFQSIQVKHAGRLHQAAVRDLLEATVDDLVHNLRVELFGERGEVGHIGEQHGDLAAFPLEGAPRGEDLLGQVARRV